MRNKLINKRAILLLAAIFLLSTSSYAPPKKGGKKPPELYKVSISINDIDDEDQVPGLENLDLVKTNGGIVENQVCGSLGYFYAERQSGSDLLNIESEGSATPDPNGEAGYLNMWVKTGSESVPIILEGCSFDDGCHLENDYSPGKIIIRFLTSQDQDGPNEDIRIHWWVDYEEVPADEITKGRKKYSRGFRLRTLMPHDEGDDLLPISNKLFPDGGLELNVPWVTDVTGPFVLLHDGKACPGGIEGENFLKVLEGFNIRLTIERVR